MKTKKITIALELLTLTVTGSLLLFSAQTALAGEVLNSIEILGPKGEEGVVLDSVRGETHQQELLFINHGTDTASLKLYLQDAFEKEGQYELNPDRAGKNDLLDWINLESDELTLVPKEQKNLVFSVKVPENAGMGNHFGAILASQRLEDGNDGIVNLDTGIRIKIAVKGESPETRYKIINSQHNSEAGNFSYLGTLVNTGNTDLRGQIHLQNQAYGQAENDAQQIMLKPGEDERISLQTSHTPLGSERITASFNLNNEQKTFVLQEGWNVPLAEILGLLFFGFFLYIITLAAQGCKETTGCPHCRKLHLAATLMLTIFGASIAVGIQEQGKALFTNIFGTDEQTFLTTVKWGTFQDKLAPEGTVTSWSGQLTVANGRMEEIEKLHQESTDRIEINSAQDTISFRNSTGPDNDGLIVLIRTPANQPAILTLQNNLSGEEVKVPLVSTLTKARLIDYQNQQIQIFSEIAPPELIEEIDSRQPTVILPGDSTTENILETENTDQEIMPPIVEVSGTPDATTLLEDLEATPDQEPLVTTLEDQESTAEITVVTDDEAEMTSLLEEIELLTGLIRDLPSSPDVIREYILNSSFISSVTSENNSTTVIGSSRLIRLLKEAPLIIRELTATPDTNFLFLPSDRIKLATQTFSFVERKTTSQEMNEMVFVQKKSTPWTVYFSISDLTAISGNGRISAANVTCNPGEITVVSESEQVANGTQIEAGPERKLTSQGDLVKLFSVTPGSEEDLENKITIFSIRPGISVFIPPETLPGLYRGEITIKAI